MFSNTHDILGRTIQAIDGAIGSVADLLFEDTTWHVRWAVIDTGHWLPGREVLLYPGQLQPSEDPKAFRVGLTKAQVEQSPGAESDLPVSRAFEEQLFAYFQLQPYWMGVAPISGTPAPVILPEPREGDPHLRSATEVVRYAIAATDGDIGHIKALLVDPTSWTVEGLEVDTGNWLPGRKVVLSPAAVTDIDHAERRCRVNLTKAMVEASPPYDPETA